MQCSIMQRCLKLAVSTCRQGYTMKKYKVYVAISWNIAKKGEAAVRLYSCYGTSLLHCNHRDMLFVCQFYQPSFLGTVITSYPKKISTCEYKLHVISQPVLFIAFSAYLWYDQWKVQIALYFFHFAAHMEINLTCKHHKLNPVQ